MSDNKSCANEVTQPEPLAAHQCPMCGLANQCSPAQAGNFDVECWCTSVTIQPEVLERLPEELRLKACICRRCATGADSKTDSAADLSTSADT